MKIIGTLLLLVCAAYAHAQTPSVLWQHKYGGTNTDQSNKVITTRDGGYMLAGITYSDDGDISYINGPSDGWLVKTDSGGNLTWQSNYGGSLNEEITGICQTKDSGYIFAGWTSSPELPLFHGGFNDVYVVKTDSIGNILWQKCYGGSGFDEATSIQLTSDGGYIIAGGTTSPDGDVTGYRPGATGFLYNVWILKLDDTGRIEWEKTYGGTNGDLANCIIQLPDSGYIVACVTGSTDSDVTYNHGLTDVWLLRLDDTGKLVWQKTYGGSEYDNVNAIIPTTGGYVFAGNTGSDDGDVTQNRGGGIYEGDMWVVKVDDTGKIVWQKTYGGSSADEAIDIVKANDSGYIFTGWTGSDDSEVTGYHDSTDCWVVRIDDTGAIVWSTIVGGTELDEGTGLLQRADNSIVVTGYSASINYGVPYGFALDDYWLFDMGTLPNSVPQTTLADNVLIYPTITTGTINAAFAQPELNVAFAVTDISGKSVPILTSGAGTSYRVSMDNNLPPGVYLLQVQHSGRVNSYEFLKK